MLSVRFAVFAGISGVALWGLFSLLENLREPELLRSPKAVVVKGCNPVETDEARELCPRLWCQKALIDARAAALGARFETTIERRAAERRLIGGVARLEGASAVHFACVLERGKVVSARAVDADELAELASGAWERT